MLSPDMEHLINSIYPGIDGAGDEELTPEYFLNRTILSARNDDVNDINSRILERLPGEEAVVYSVDSVAPE
ncbi:hypothetical protein SCHPADRAFT_808204, partial [Schizopora paradoxa]